MPFNFRIPLPGPFSYSRRVGGRGKNRAGRAASGLVRRLPSGDQAQSMTDRIWAAPKGAERRAVRKQVRAELLGISPPQRRNR